MATFDTSTLDKALRERRQRLAAEQAEMLDRVRRALGPDSRCMDKETFAVLEADLRARSRDIARIGERIQSRLETFAQSPEGVDSMGYQLHNLYGACEQLFEVITRFFENRVDEGRYHADLLRRMQLDLQGIRPALLSEETADALDELRRFRRLFRHAYTANLDAGRVAGLAAGAARVRGDFEADLERFLALLRPE